MKWLPDYMINACDTYRDAVRLCWLSREQQNRTMRTLAELADLYPSHVSDYLSVDSKKRNLPAEKIPGFEKSCGNYAITQWLVRQHPLTILDEILAKREGG